MTPYDPARHHRRSIRLKGYDYAQAGAYFVTIGTHNRECLFGAVVDGEMVLSRFGQVAAESWCAIPRHFPYVELDEWVVMPNHVHGILWILADGPGSRPRRGEAFTMALAPTNGATAGDPNPRPYQAAENASPLRDNTGRPHGAPAGSLGAIVGNFKSMTTRRINRMRHIPGAPLWQRNYYEHIVRGDEDLERTRAYIAANPLHWAEDEENPSERRARGQEEAHP